MSKDVNRHRVFQTTRVRTALKNDGCWIHKSKEENEEQDKARTENDVETKPAPVRQHSYVLSTAKKFESLDSPVSPPFQKMQFAPSEGNSCNQVNGEVIPPQKDAQPEGSTVETTHDAKAKAPTEELIQNGGTQPEKSDANTTAENKEEHAAVDPSNEKHNDGAAEVSAEVHVAECIPNGDVQPVSSTSPEAVSPVEPTEQPVINTTAENKEDHADTTVDQSNVVSADVHVEDPVSEPSAAAVTEENKATAEVPVEPTDELKHREEPSTKTELVYVTHLKDTGVESVQPAEGSCEKWPPEQVAEKIIEAVPEVVVKSSSNSIDVVNATPGKEDAPQNSVETVAEVVVNSPTDTSDVVSATPGKEPAFQDSVETVAEIAMVSETPVITDAVGKEAAPKSSVEAVAEVVVTSSLDTNGEVCATPGEEAAAAPPNSGETVAEVAVVPETPDVTHAAGEEAAPQNSVEAVAGVTLESSPETPVGSAAGEEATFEVVMEPIPDSVTEPVSELPSQSTTETVTEGTCEKGPVKAVDDAAVKSSPETPAVTGATEEETALQVRVDPVPDLVADTTKPAAETAVKSVECEVEPAAPEVQPVHNNVVEPTPESAADRVGELNIEDAVKPVTVTNAEAVPDKFSDRPIELSEALDVKPPKTEVAPEPLNGHEQSHTEETKLNQHSDGTNISEMFQKPEMKLQYTPSLNITRSTNECSICLKTFDGNVKLHLSDPVLTCHPECLKCGVCDKVLGDLLTPMFLHGQEVQCGNCFAKTLKP